MLEDKKRYLITSALPYVNTVKHLGNLVSSLLPADILARYLRQRGEEVLAVCGTDDHGTPAEVSALEAGIPVEKFVEQMSMKQKDIYERFGFSYDIFSRTHTPEHAEFTVSDSVFSIDFDPDLWLLKRVNIYYGVEELVKDTPVFNDFSFVANPSRTPVIQYVINQTGMVKITLYDVCGRHVQDVASGVHTPGKYSTSLSQIPAGVYFCRMETPVNEKTKKIVKVH